MIYKDLTIQEKRIFNCLDPVFIALSDTQRRNIIKLLASKYKIVMKGGNKE
ncbi:MAG: hypothetical protein ACTSU7_00150 [Candidatus Heimdallarchaeaceae archaeon]